MVQNSEANLTEDDLKKLKKLEAWEKRLLAEEERLIKELNFNNSEANLRREERRKKRKELEAEYERCTEEINLLDAEIDKNISDRWNHFLENKMKESITHRWRGT